MDVTRSLTVALALLTAGALNTANAVPCGAYSTVGGIKIGATDLGASATTCRNSVSGDANDSVEDLNDGVFFGNSNWMLLDRPGDNQIGDADFWSFTNSTKPNGTISGQFSLAAGIWSEFSKLVVVLKDGGSTTNRNIKWSAYLLPTDLLGVYDWSYDKRKELSHATLYGVEGGTTTVPEPASLLMLGLGLTGAGFTLRKKLRA